MRAKLKAWWLRCPAPLDAIRSQCSAGLIVGACIRLHFFRLFLDFRVLADGSKGRGFELSENMALAYSSKLLFLHLS